MAQRETPKAKRPVAKRVAKHNPSASDMRLAPAAPDTKRAASASDIKQSLKRLEARARALEQERDALKASLDLASARIREMEEEREQIVNRIDWVVDSLEGALEAPN